MHPIATLLSIALLAASPAAPASPFGQLSGGFT